MSTTAMLERESSCGCPHLTPPITHGRTGWHFERNSTHPTYPQADVAFEPCLAYRRGVERRKERER
jgi:hypothetical protein